jgi:hypothetical protein
VTEQPPRRKWGRAGERLHPDGTRDSRRLREVRAEVNRSRAARLEDDRVAYKRWRAGQVCPAQITMALDLNQLYGPQVDLACRAEEPAVDQWEAGERYPSWGQLCALAELTGMSVRWFTINDQDSGPVPLWKTSIWFHISEPERRAYEKHYRPPIMTYPRAVIDEAMLHTVPSEMPDPAASAAPDTTKEPEHG